MLLGFGLGHSLVRLLRFGQILIDADAGKVQVSKASFMARIVARARAFGSVAVRVVRAS